MDGWVLDMVAFWVLSNAMQMAARWVALDGVGVGVSGCLGDGVGVWLLELKAQSRDTIPAELQCHFPHSHSRVHHEVAHPKKRKNKNKIPTKR